MNLLESFLVPKAEGKAFVVTEGQLLRLTQPEGPQVIDFNDLPLVSHRPTEKLLAGTLWVSSNGWSRSPWRHRLVHSGRVIAGTGNLPPRTWRQLAEVCE